LPKLEAQDHSADVKFRVLPVFSDSISSVLTFNFRDEHIREFGTELVNFHETSGKVERGESIETMKV
jgi:hypothetical protein